MKTARVENFQVIIERGMDGYFIARVPALPGCLTQAKTYEKLMQRVREAIELCLEVAEQDADYRKETEKSSVRPVFVGMENVAVRL